MTPTEEFSKRYGRVEREADKIGRMIGVRRLKPSEQLKVMGMTPELDGDMLQTERDGSPKRDADGREIRIPNRFPAIVAAAVCEINGNPVTFPRSRAELDSVIDMLDEEGLQAAGEALARLATGGGGEGADTAKN